ncbi:major facilitator superfamily domain-containing protein [Microdochium trichocladiopsis]|uniref:Major facilitator superfamily domain-containing protein n=1 Tax=Microdochium trichocladiopsis TaxID=1682393 RepID=A0A9P8Y427_9PEZI|nr:major facilitator superfamily domain-containing protein [Microdochium trichocladiopsis]KAH7028154.1 major facilitator superfamily domain-containing protein [Microdochium trichocladiopsis]
MASTQSGELQIPGTVYLVDVAQDESNIHARHDGSHQDIVLVPQPSSDPEDPLNWTYRRKLLAVSMGYLYVLGTGIATSLQYSVLANITADTGISTADLVQGTGLMFLFFRWACLIWQPIALTYGRRGVYLITMFLTIPIMVWTAYSSSSGEWAAHRVLIGIIVSPIESLCEVTIFDLFFAHNRGTYMGLYVFVLFGSNFLAPLVAGWFNDAYGWRWTMHFGAIVCAVCFVIMFFFLEETIYFRERSIEGQAAPPQPLVPGASTTNNPGSETPTATAKDEKSNSRPASSSTSSSPNRAICPPHSQGLLGKYALFRPLPGRPSNRDMLRMLYRPILMIFRLPTVAWSGFLYGINLAWYNVLNGTVSPVLTRAPYNWSAALVGCVYAGPIVGAAIACLWSGKVADWVAIRLARRHHGVREAEYRLWVLAVSGVVSSGGLILWGVGAYHDLPWIGLVFGLGMLTFGVVTGGSIAVSYNVDCFKEIAGETTVSVMIIRNTIGFGFSYGITPWWTNTGLQNCFIAAAMISIACTATFFVFILFGKRIRRWSIPAYQGFIATTVVSQE